MWNNCRVRKTHMQTEKFLSEIVDCLKSTIKPVLGNKGLSANAIVGTPPMQLDKLVWKKLWCDTRMYYCRECPHKCMNTLLSIKNEKAKFCWYMVKQYPWTVCMTKRKLSILTANMHQTCVMAGSQITLQDNVPNIRKMGGRISHLALHVLVAYCEPGFIVQITKQEQEGLV